MTPTSADGSACSVNAGVVISRASGPAAGGKTQYLASEWPGKGKPDSSPRDYHRRRKVRRETGPPLDLQAGGGARGQDRQRDSDFIEVHRVGMTVNPVIAERLAVVRGDDHVRVLGSPCLLIASSNQPSCSSR